MPGISPRRVLRMSQLTLTSPNPGGRARPTRAGWSLPAARLQEFVVFRVTRCGTALCRLVNTEPDFPFGHLILPPGTVGVSLDS